jgi:hypothetical protein
LVFEGSCIASARSAHGVMPCICGLIQPSAACGRRSQPKCGLNAAPNVAPASGPPYCLPTRPPFTQAVGFGHGGAHGCRSQRVVRAGLVRSRRLLPTAGCSRLLQPVSPLPRALCEVDRRPKRRPRAAHHGACWARTAVLDVQSSVPTPWPSTTTRSLACCWDEACCDPCPCWYAPRASHGRWPPTQRPR